MKKILMMSVICILMLVGCTEKHEWIEADCTTPRTCSKCEETEGDLLGHDWKEASCEKSKTCTRCGKTEGSPLEHQMEVHENIEHCKLCGKETVVSRLSTQEADVVFETEFHNFENVIIGLSGLLTYWNEASLDTEQQVNEYEQMWQKLANDVKSIQQQLDKNRPPERYDTLWLEWRDCFKKMEKEFLKGTTMDVDNDGTYTKSEMESHINTLSTNLIALFQEAIDITERINNVSPEQEVSKIPENNSPNKEQHKCIKCSKNATNPYLNPFSGQQEYYCSKHYYELQEMMDNILGNTTSSPNSTSAPNIENTNSARHSDIEAWSCAQNIVEENLKSPSTAIFCSFTEATITHLENGEYMVLGWVDAQNGFGATVRSDFVVTYTATVKGYKNAQVVFS